MMKKLLDINNPVMQFLSGLFDLAILNILWGICSLPVLTIGSAATAAYAVCFQMIQGKNTGIVKPFFKSFRLNFRQATMIWGITAIAFGVFSIDVWFLLLQSYITGIARTILCGLIIVFFVTAFLASICAFAFLSLFENTVKEILQNAILMVLQNPLRMLCILIVDAAIGVLTVFSILSTPLLSTAMCFLCFSSAIYLNSLILFPVFKPFLTSEAPAEMQ